MNCCLRAFVLLLLSVLITPVFAADKLLFAFDVIRHGDRNPILMLPNSTYQSIEGPGQLTALGMRQEYELGQKLRELYIKQHQLLPERYIPHTLYARSTDIDRTLMSAQSFLMGLYPPDTGPYLKHSNQPALPEAYQPIPIHTTQRKQDSLVLDWHDSEEVRHLIRTLVFSSPDWESKRKALQHKFKRWSRLTGVKIEGLEYVTPIGDALHIHQLQGVPFPKGMTHKEATEIMEAAYWAFTRFYQDPKIAKAMVGKEIAAIAQELQTASEKKGAKKYHLFFAHDTTILCLLSALEAPLKTPPPYASRLNFSIFEQEDGLHHVQITLNESPVFIPACGGASCSLEQFVTLSQKVY